MTELALGGKCRNKGISCEARAGKGIRIHGDWSCEMRSYAETSCKYRYSIYSVSTELRFRIRIVFVELW